MDVTRIPVDASTRVPGGRTNAYLVGESDALLVDPAARTDSLDAALTARSVAHVTVTHHHPDHVGGVAHFARECDATVWARAGREAAFESATGVSPDRTFRAGTAIPAGDGVVRVIETPGHAPEHAAFAVDGDLLAGDLAVAEGSVAVAAPEGDVRAYLTSLRRVRALSPDRLLPGHGPVVEDPSTVCERLIAHRLDRERRVAAAVEGGAGTVDAVVDAAYDRDLTDLRDLARATVRAHLAKLAVEGRVTLDGDRVRLGA